MTPATHKASEKELKPAAPAPVPQQEEAGAVDLARVQSRLPVGYKVARTKGGERGQGRFSVSRPDGEEIFSVTTDKAFEGALVDAAVYDSMAGKKKIEADAAQSPSVKI